MKQLFYLLVPPGAAVLIFSICGLIGAVKVKLLYEQPYAEGSGSFTVTEAGNYGIWLNRRQPGKSLYGEFGLQLSRKETGKMIPPSRVLLRTSVNGFGTARMELYTFHAEMGNYTLRRADEANLGGRMLSGIGRVLNRYSVDYTQFSLRTYPHRTAALGVVYSFGITPSLTLMIQGILLPHYLQAKALTPSNACVIAGTLLFSRRGGDCKRYLYYAVGQGVALIRGNGLGFAWYTCRQCEFS